MSEELSHEALYLLRILHEAERPMSETEMFVEHVKHLYGRALEQLERAGFIRDVEMIECDYSQKPMSELLSRYDTTHKITVKGMQYNQHLRDLRYEEMLQKYGLKEDLKQ